MAESETPGSPKTEGEPKRTDIRDRVRSATRWIAYPLAGILVGAAILLIAGNALFATQRNVPYRALDPRHPVCQQDAAAGWDILERTVPSTSRPIGNDEWAAVEVGGANTHQRLTCAIQRHALSGYHAADGTARQLSYDLAFVELQEDGKPYVLREPCGEDRTGCTGQGSVAARKVSDRKSQLQILLDHLESDKPNYVLVFIHGWRHNADVGDSNVGDLRHYAAHAARFLEDRFAGNPSRKPRVTAVYIGWRGARTDETWAKHRFGLVGEWIASFSALPTLFDRKPVSEAVAPAALSALRAIERRLKIDGPLASPEALPTSNSNHMIVFGHSLGGNMLATALEDDLVKKVVRHRAGSYMLPAVGDLVVLINPAAEASKWIAVQRAVWQRIPMSRGERASGSDYSAGHNFFHPEQRPIVVSVTAALDWPPGGRTEADCAPSVPVGGPALAESRDLVKDGIEYNWATYDLFPAFKGDFRPIADSLVRLSSGRDPHDQCLASVDLTSKQRVFGWTGAIIARVLRVLPFMQTNPEETHTIGHLDPTRAAQGSLTNYFFPTRPFGTTHELRGLPAGASIIPRKRAIPPGEKREREVPLDYGEVAGGDGACPSPTSWLSMARAQQRAGDPSGHGTYWASAVEGPNAPALQFAHGFQKAGIAAITRARDPFWNMRAFDTALARHDGYMLTSFICAMNQLVMDDITTFSGPTAGSTGSSVAPSSIVPPAAVAP